MWFPKLLPPLLVFLLDVCETRAKGGRQGALFLNPPLVPWQRGRGAKRARNAAKGSSESDESNEADAAEPNLRINKFDAQEVKINSSLNVNVFRSDSDTTSAYDEGICIYNILKDIEVKDVKRVPRFNQKLANVHLQKERDCLKLSRGREEDAHLDSPLIYKDTNYQLPYVLNYYPDDMFILNFDGVISMNKQEQIVVAFLTFLRLFQMRSGGSTPQGYPSLLFNGNPIEGLPLYNFFQSRSYLFTEGETSSVPPPSDDPFILLKLIPKFLYSRFLYLYKYLKSLEDLVVAIKYVYDEVDSICTKHRYDVNEMLRICRERNGMQARLEEVRGYLHRADLKQPHQGELKQPEEEATTQTHLETRTQLHIYNLVKELTKGTFNPSVICPYKKMENFQNVFPSFHHDFDDFYKKKMNLKLYQRYRVDPKWVRTQFERTRELLKRHEADAYTHLMQYRYPCGELTQQERQNHRTFNFCAVDLINHNINVFKKPVYIVSTMESGGYIEETLKLFGVDVANEGDAHLLRIFGRDYLRRGGGSKKLAGVGGGSKKLAGVGGGSKKLAGVGGDSKKFAGVGGDSQKSAVVGEVSTNEDPSNSVMANLRRLFNSPYFAKGARRGGHEGSPHGGGEGSIAASPQDDYLYDPYNVDLDYLKHREKTNKRDYHFVHHGYYLHLLREKCNLINHIIEEYHRGEEPIHVIDQKYEDLNAMCNDSRFGQKVRLYLCEWGYNSYADRLKAIHNDRVKSFSQSFKLVFLCCTPLDSPRREHTHGRGLPADFYTKFMLKYLLRKGLLTRAEASAG
ncbi:hypothetical protein PVMG_01832 [Plasmodium vivax Mauritania I]|uniref:Uncharacterized protein n=1 Tax=Plasmodium vivax Mauritania I TaxID=1035515 RepID=A0A0J9TGZ4_PLAVI|nr:hypothetical protein PVMG_01832 [Plasmodium vivax Mauritania I]